MSIKDIEHIFERLRSGVVPERGLETFAVGIDKQRTEIHRQLKLAADGEGVFKFLRGGYGCGKTLTSSANSSSPSKYYFGFYIFP